MLNHKIISVKETTVSELHGLVVVLNAFEEAKTLTHDIDVMFDEMFKHLDEYKSFVSLMDDMTEGLGRSLIKMVGLNPKKENPHIKAYSERTVKMKKDILTALKDQYFRVTYLFEENKHFYEILTDNMADHLDKSEYMQGLNDFYDLLEDAEVIYKNMNKVDFKMSSEDLVLFDSRRVHLENIISQMKQVSEIITDENN